MPICMAGESNDTQLMMDSFAHIALGHISMEQGTQELIIKSKLFVVGMWLCSDN